MPSKSNHSPLLIFQKKKKAPPIAIDIEKDVVRVVEMSGGQPPRLDRLRTGKIELPEGDLKADVFGVALKKALDQIGARPKAAYMCVPRAQVVLRPLIVPNLEDVREMAAIVNFQISKDLPFRIEDAVVDFKVLRMLEPIAAPPVQPTEGAPATPEGPAVPQPRLEVLVGAVKKDVVDFQKAVAAAAGFELAGLALRSSAYVRVLRACGETPPDAALALIVLRQEEITVEVIANEALALSRVINVPLPAPNASAEAESAFLNAVALEVVRSLHSYDGMMWHKPIAKVLVGGASGLELKVAEALGIRLQLPASVLDLRDSLRSKDATREELSAALAPIGLSIAAQDPAGLPIDFIDPKKPAVPGNSRRTKIIIAAAAVLVVMAGLFGVRARLIQNHNKIKQAVQDQVTEAEKKSPLYRKLKSQTKVVKAWADDDQNWLDHLAYLSGILPPADQLYINAIATTSQRIIRMSVQARTGELLAELDKKLRSAGYEVKPLSITPATDKYGYNFRTTVELNVPKKMKVDLQKVSAPKRPEDDISGQKS